jgi:2-polyprenyl-3-methyl-5-hydroxy-6-metoxy-1,4-benzoquinol methylase
MEEMFRDGIHLATYRDAEEMLDKARYYLAHENIRERIATAGMAEATSKHTYSHRMQKLLGQSDSHLARTAVSVQSDCPGAFGDVPATDPRDFVYFDFARPELVALVPPAAREILDVGCGAGRLGEALKLRQNARVTGIESNRGAAETARQRLDRVLAGDVEQLNPKWGSHVFDVVICGDVLEHLRDPATVLSRIHHWLRPGGRIIASIPNVRHHSVIRGLLRGDWTYEPAGLLDQTHLRFFTRREIEKMFFRCGFRIVDISFVPGAEHTDWVASGRSELSLGGLTVNGLPLDELEEFHVYQYLIVAEPAPIPDFGLTSIVIVTHNEVDYTRRCLESIRQFTDERFELVVVDNASCDGTQQYLHALGNVRLIPNDRNVGFPAAANQGIAASQGHQILLLNNDTLVATGWLRWLLEALHSSQDVGLVVRTTSWTDWMDSPGNGDVSMRGFAKRWKP